MSEQLTRRRVLITSTAALTTGAIATAIATDETRADVQASFTVADSSHTVTNPVSGLSLAANGTYAIDMSDTPERVVVRLEAKRTEWAQIAAVKANGAEGEFALTGNLLDAPDLNAHHVNPSNGETKSVTIHARVSVEVYAGGSKVATGVDTDDFTVQVSKERGEIDVSVEASGRVAVETASES